MLEQLLAEIHKGGTLNPFALAARLGVGPALIEMMLEDLERKGRLTRLPTACGGDACKGCPVATTCAPRSANPARVWMLASKPAGIK